MYLGVFIVDARKKSFKSQLMKWEPLCAVLMTLLSKILVSNIDAAGAPVSS